MKLLDVANLIYDVLRVNRKIDELYLANSKPEEIQMKIDDEVWIINIRKGQNKEKGNADA